VTSHALAQRDRRQARRPSQIRRTRRPSHTRRIGRPC